MLTRIFLTALYLIADLAFLWGFLDYDNRPTALSEIAIGFSILALAKLYRMENNY